MIELLVVIAIIALLVSMLLPSLKRAKDLARQAVCLSNKHSIALAVRIYANDHDGTVPSAPNWTQVPSREQRPWYWFHLPENYATLSDKFIAKCPEDPEETMSLTSGFCGAYEPHIGGFSYATSDAACFEEQYPPPNWGDKSKLTLLHMDQAPAPGELLFITCTATNWGGTFRGANKFGRFKAGQNKAVWLAHPSGTAGLFVDGHAVLLDSADLLNVCNGGRVDTADDNGIFDYWTREGQPSWQ